MPKILQGQTLSGIIKDLGTTPEAFLKSNPSFAGKGGANDYMGLSGNIQAGQEYAVPGATPTNSTITPTIKPVPGSGNYAEDLTKQIQQKQDLLNQANTKGYTSNETFTADASGNISGTSEAERAKVRKAEIEKIKSELSGGLVAPTPYKSVEEFNKLRTEQGVVKDNEELASIQNEAATLKEELRQFGATSGEGVSEGGRTGMMSEKERNIQFKLEGLALRENAVVNRLNTKNSYINTVLSLGKDDYNTALANYNNEYTKNSKAVELYNTNLSNDQKDAMTGFTTLTNLLKDSNVDMTKISPTIKANIDSLALQAGLPSGVFEAFASAYPDAKILSPVTVDNASGGKDIYFFTQDAKTGQPTLIKTLGLAGAGDGSTTVAPGVTVDPVISGMVSTILGSGKFTKDQAKAVKNAINNGEDPLTVIKNQAKNIMGQTEATTVTKYEAAKNAMLDVQTALSEFYAKGGTTNIFSGNFERVINKLGQVDKPELVDLATQIQASLQVYRNSVSGTAYSVQEGKDINSIFPGIDKSQGLNQSIINGRLKAFDSAIDGTYKAVLGNSYDKIKNTTVTSTLKPEDIKYTFDSVAGSDGKVSPADWLKMKNMYIQSGGTAEEFDSAYNNYKNPKNKYYQ